MDAKPLPAGMLRALAALHGPRVPMTAAERQAFDRQRRDEMARAEAARTPTPDLFKAAA